MIIGFGFGNLWTTLIMLLITGTLSYFLFRFLNGGRTRRFREDSEDRDRLKKQRREYYHQQREKARAMQEKYNLSDEEIERIIEEELRED